MKKIFGIVFLTVFLIGCTTEIDTSNTSGIDTIDNTIVTEEVINETIPDQDDETVEEFKELLDDLINTSGQ